MNLTFWVDVDEFDEHTVTVEYKDTPELPEFIEFDDKELLEIRPKTKEDSGYFVLKITVTDDNSNDCPCGVKSGTIFLVIRVFYELQEIDFLELFGVIPDWLVSPLENPEFNIIDITQTGLMTIEFSHDMLVPKDPYKVINKDALMLNLTTNYEIYEPSLMLRNWTTVKMTSEMLQIQLNFTDPILISSYIVDPDMINI